MKEYTMKKLAFLLLLAFTQQTYAKPLIYCSEGSPSSFNPQIFTDGTSSNASTYTIYNRLVEFEVGTTKVIPALATSYEVSKDKLTYTFKLRPGVKFQTTSYFTPTRDFNSDDVLFSINRQRVKDHAYHSVGGGNYEYFDGMDMGNIIKDVKAVDPLTVVITLAKPNAPFLANMSMSFMSILSKEYADKLASINKKENIDKEPIGTGPFAFSSYTKDNALKLVKHDKYWGKRGNVDKLIFAITPDASVRTQKLKVGECNFIAEPAPADISDLKKNTKVSVVEASGLNVGYLAMNVTKKPFDNLLVRQAIHHALNRKSYIDAVYMGSASVAKNPIPATIWSYNNSIKDYEYDVKKAQDLMKKAGLPNGFETEMWTLPVSRPYNPNGKKMGELMQADLAKIGIKVKLLTFDWPTYLKKSKEGSHALIQFGWTGDNGDPDNFMGTLLSCDAVGEGSNYARWCDKSFDKLIVEAREATDVKKRTSLYMDAQKVFKAQAPWVTIAHSIQFRAMGKNVKGYKLDPLGHDIFTMINIE
jgi:dipeptide transport system substrate-binding protein